MRLQKFAVLMLASSLLSSCASNFREEAAHRCASYGLKPGDENFDYCYTAEYNHAALEFQQFAALIAGKGFQTVPPSGFAAALATQPLSEEQKTALLIAQYPAYRDLIVATWQTHQRLGPAWDSMSPNDRMTAVSTAMAETRGQLPTTIQPFANGTIINRAGEMPTTVMPFAGGAIVNTPGQAPTTVMPFANGAVINQPGSLPTTVMPFGQGAIVNPPGGMPTTIQRFGNGAVINAAGQIPVVCMPFANGMSCH